MKKNPNAVAAGGSGVAATILVGTLAYFGVGMEPVFAAALTTAASTAVLLVGRKGISGLARQLWRGSEEK
jgi:hypothetical protein